MGRADDALRQPAAHSREVWWYDYGRHEIVRTRDGTRWPAEDVPELRRSIDEWSTNPVVDVEAIDRWVAAQGELP